MFFSGQLLYASRTQGLPFFFTRLAICRGRRKYVILRQILASTRSYTTVRTVVSCRLLLVSWPAHRVVNFQLCQQSEARGWRELGCCSRFFLSCDDVLLHFTIFKVLAVVCRCDSTYILRGRRAKGTLCADVVVRVSTKKCLHLFHISGELETKPCRFAQPPCHSLV